MSEDDFLRQVAPLPDHDYFCFFEANHNLGSHSFSRAYINFIDSIDTLNFRERFDNYIFLDKGGQEYPAVVEQSFWHKSPKNGPFYSGSSQAASILPSESAKLPEPMDNQADQREDEEDPVAPLSIEQDPDFLEFMEKHKNLKKRNQQSPIQTLETNLDELTKQSNSGPAGKKGHNKVMTPLLGYVNQKRVIRNNRRTKK